MYWRFKLPLILVLLAILAFLCYKVVVVFKERQAEVQAKTHPATPSPAPAIPEIPAPAPKDQLNPIEQPGTFTVAEIPDHNGKQTPKVTQTTPDTPLAPTQTAAPSPVASAPQAVISQPAPPETIATTPAPSQTIAPQRPPAPTPTDISTASDSPTHSSALDLASSLAANTPIKARELAWDVLAQPDVREYSREWFQAAELINSINKTVTTSAVAFPEKQTYVIKSGDVLVRVAHRQKTTVQLLMEMNRIRDPRKIWPNQKLAFISGPWSIRVSKSHFLLSLYRDGKLYRIYKVGIGRDNRTPVGTFQIRDKVINPHWDSPEGRIPPSDPRNILGTRWMGLDATGETSQYLTGYGIHGTTLPDTVGTPSSAGCVRLKNEDIEDLYNYIPEPASDKVQVTIIE